MGSPRTGSNPVRSVFHFFLSFFFFFLAIFFGLQLFSFFFFLLFLFANFFLFAKMFFHLFGERGEIFLQVKIHFFNVVHLFIKPYFHA